MPKIFICGAAILILLFFYSCQKDPAARLSNISNHHLVSEDYKTLKKEQAIEIFDSTALNDSAKMVNPPSDKIYKWKVIPDNGCATFWGKYKNGDALITFHCPGKYQIFATIYDSTSQSLVGTTDTFNVEVNNDILYPTQPIKSNDILKLRPSIVKSWYYPHDPKNDPPDELYIQLIYSTTQEYEYNSGLNHINIDSSITPGNYVFNFGDSVRLLSYPFSNGNYIFGNVDGVLDLKRLIPGVPANYTIEWLGKMNTGKVTLINNNQFSFKADNNYNIIIN